MNFHQIWEIASAPDNVPIVALLFLIPFYVWYAFRQAFENDRLIDKLSADPKLAKTEHRKTEPWNPKVTMNPAKAPWYFLGLQEMLVYFDPWIAGVIMPTFIIVGLMIVPYIDANPLGNGYYTYKQRRFAIWTFLFGFIGLWVLMIFIGTFIRGPGWMWFWPGQTWDAQRVEFAVNRNMDQIFGVNGAWMVHLLPAANASYAPILARIIFGIFPLALYFLVAGYFSHRLLLLTEFSRKIFKRMTLLQMF